MKAWIYTILFDLVFFIALYCVYTGNALAVYGENLIGFVCICLLVLYGLALFRYEEAGKSVAVHRKFKPRPTWQRVYAVSTYTIQIAALAALNWYWCAAGMLVSFIYTSVVWVESDKWIKKSKEGLNVKE